LSFALIDLRDCRDFHLKLIEKVRASSTQSSGKFIDAMIAQWMNQTGNNDRLQQTEEVRIQTAQE